MKPKEVSTNTKYVYWQVEIGTFKDLSLFDVIWKSIFGIHLQPVALQNDQQCFP